MDILNRTDILATPLFLPDMNGAETLLVVVKGTWRIHQDGALSVADEQVPVRFDPLYFGDAGASSLLYDTDVVLEKPGTDCILLGHAWSPGAPVGSLDVSFAVGPVHRTVRVFGDRVWRKSLTTSRSQPLPFESIPLLWERSFGGTDTSWPDDSEHEICPDNPVGRGFFSRKTRLQIDGMSLPNIEDPACLIRAPKDRLRPSGFAPIPSHWHSRARHAGTYDKAWQRYRAPLPPEDLDPRYHSSAAPGLATAAHLAGDEPVSADNASKRGRVAFCLPGVKPLVRLRVGRADEELTMALDTVVVEPDEERLVLVWRGKRVVHGRIHDLGNLTVDLQRL